MRESLSTVIPTVLSEELFAGDYLELGRYAASGTKAWLDVV